MRLACKILLCWWVQSRSSYLFSRSLDSKCHVSPAQLAAYTAVFMRTICDDCVVDTHYRVDRNKQPGASHFTRATLARVLTMQAPPISLCGGDLQLHVCILSKRTDRSNWFWQYYWHYYHSLVASRLPKAAHGIPSGVVLVVVGDNGLRFFTAYKSTTLPHRPRVTTECCS